MDFFSRVDRLNEMPIPVFKLVHETKGSTDILYEFEISPSSLLRKDANRGQNECLL